MKGGCGRVAFWADPSTINHKVRQGDFEPLISNTSQHQRDKHTSLLGLGLGS